MISPTFEPGGKPGGGIAAFAGGFDTGQNWMSRAQQQQMRAQEIQENIDLAPVKALKREADKRTYEAQLTNAQIMEATRKEAAEQAPHLLAEFLDIAKIPDLDRKAAELDAFAAKTAWLSNMPENKAFIESVKHAQGQAHLDSIAMGKIAQAKEASTQRAATAEGQIEQRAKAAELQAKTNVEMQSMKGEIERYKQEAQGARTDSTNKTRENVAQMNAQRPANQAALKANEAVLQIGQSAAQELINTKQALAILDSPEIKTGTGAQFKLAAQRLGGMIGVDVGDAKDIEKLQSVFGDTLLAKAKQLKGNFSDRDREFIDRISPTIAKTTEGNRMIINLIKSHQERQIEIAKMVNEGRREGLSEREIQLEVNDFVLSNPLGGVIMPPTAAAFSDPEKEKRYQELKRAKAERDALNKK